MNQHYECDQGFLGEGETGSGTNRKRIDTALYLFALTSYILHAQYLALIIFNQNFTFVPEPDSHSLTPRPHLSLLCSGCGH